VPYAPPVVITVGCGDECPFYPGKRYLDWEFDDQQAHGRDVSPERLLAEDCPAAPAGGRCDEQEEMTATELWAWR